MRQLHLNAFLRNIGQHEAAWRLPETDLSAVTNVDHYISLARIAERWHPDAVFFADHPVLNGESQLPPWDTLDPVTLPAAIGTVRRLATLDHLSKGRAAWNAVTTAIADASRNFGFPAHPDREDRYRGADGFLERAEEGRHA